jgi:hypothetical protein
MIRAGAQALALILAVNVFFQDAGPRSTDAKPDQGAIPKGKSERSNVKAPTIDADVRSLVDETEALPPEFASDALLQLVEKGLIRNDGLKTKLLSRAFQKASASRDDVMLRPWGVNVEETPQGLHAIASTVTQLDRISLQARTVRGFFSISHRRAREAFESMPPPRIQPIACGENWYFVPDSYYDILGMLVEHSFSAREIAGGFRTRYVNTVIQNIHSHVELAPMAQVLSTGNFTGQELREIVPAYAATVGDLSGDAFSFDVIMAEPDRSLESFSRLIESLRKADVDSRPLLLAFRNYLVLNFSGASCGTTQISKVLGSTLPGAVLQFNKRFAGALTRANLRPIRESEIKSDRKENVERNTTPRRWQSQAYSQLSRSLQRLTPPGRQRSSAGGYSDWLSQAGDLLSQVTAWSDTSELETEFFHQKAILIEGLAERTIGTSMHAEVLATFIGFLEQNSYQKVGAIDWFLYAKKLLSAGAESGNASADARVLLDSREPVLSIYAKLELLSRSAKGSPSGEHPGQDLSKQEHK